MSFSEITTNQIRALFENKNIAVFSGAGLSIEAPSFCPDWNEFRSMILDAFLRSTASRGLLESSHRDVFHKHLVAGFRNDPTRQFKPEVFMELLRDQIGDHALGSLSILQGGSYNTNHLFLARAAKAGHLNVIITTNFDQYIEHALRDLGAPHQVYCHSSDFAVLAAKSDWLREGISVLKLHGSLEQPETIRMTLKQAAHPLEEEKASTLRSVLCHSNVLFYGYSGNDDDIYPILHDSHAIALGIVWCLWDLSSLSPAIDRLLSKYGKSAKVLNQHKEPLFSKLFSQLEYDRSRPSNSQQSGSDAEAKTSKKLADQRVLDEWAKAIEDTDLMHVLASTSRSISDFELAKIAMWKELDLLKQNLDWSQFASTDRDLGGVLEMEQDWNSAFDCYAESMVVTQKLGDDVGYAHSCTKMAKLQFYLGDSEKAVEFAEEGIRFYEAHDMRSSLADALNTIAEVHMHQGRVDAARGEWGRALQICEQDGDLVNASVTSSNLAMAFRLQGNHQGARALLEKALELNSRHGDLMGVAFTYGNLAFLDEDAGEFQRAMNEIDQAIEMLKKVHAGIAHFDSTGGGVAFYASLEKHINARHRIEAKLKANA